MGFGGGIHLLLAIDRPTGRRKDDFPHSMLDRLLQDVQRPKDINLGIETSDLRQIFVHPSAPQDA